MMDDYWTHLRARPELPAARPRDRSSPRGTRPTCSPTGPARISKSGPRPAGPSSCTWPTTRRTIPIQPPPDWLAKVQAARAGHRARSGRRSWRSSSTSTSALARCWTPSTGWSWPRTRWSIFTSDNGGNLDVRRQQRPLAERQDAHVRRGPARARRGPLAGEDQAAAAAPNTWPYRWIFSPRSARRRGSSRPQDIDGVSFLPTLLGKRQPEPPRNRYFVLREGGPIFGGKTSNALIEGAWKLLQDRPVLPLGTATICRPTRRNRPTWRRKNTEAPGARCGDAQAHPAGRPGSMGTGGSGGGVPASQFADQSAFEKVARKVPRGRSQP